MKTLIATAALSIAAAAHAVTYPIVDTGQTAVYGDAPGQDAHYAANAPSYKDNGDGTIYDRVTGLMWTQDPGEKMTHATAVKNAAQCRVGGHDDWRLPTIKELYSLMNFNGIDPDPRSEETANLTPFIDHTVFDFEYGDPAKGERIIDSQFATSTIYVSTTMGGNKTMFGVNFADGRIKGYPVVSPRGEKTYFVLYVRENPNYGKNEFKDNGDGTITDAATGLMWMKADSETGMDWPTALAYAEGMERAGHSDWRLPTAKELQSIVDYSRAPDATDSPAIDPLFECAPITNEAGQKDYAQYWSSTTHVGSRGSDRAAYVCFGRGLGKMRDRWMDVHGAGCQRSDTKTGDPADYPKSHGPQGDVQRLTNFVRLVRGGGVEKVDVHTISESPNIRPARAPNETQARKGPSPDRMFERFDTDQDGEITQSEFKGPDRRFNRIDADGDGVITRAEAEAAPPPPARRGEREGAAPPSTPPPPAPLTARDAARPNIVFILADDMGWTGTSVEMIPGDAGTKSDFYQTPNLEKLAAAGTRFSQAYAPAALCTPSRAAILTGKTPAENQITTPGGGRAAGTEKLTPPTQRTDIPAEETTIPEALKRVGYATAHLGKWHIGRGEPGSHGFDLHDGATGNEASGAERDPKEIFSLTERGVAFMREHAATGRPFYLQLSHYAVHSPVEAREASIAKFEKLPAGERHFTTDYAAMTWDLDQSVGILLAEIETLGLATNTYVVFLSDNGAAGGKRTPHNTPLNKGKGSLLEGGVRVPLLIAGPGVQAGATSNEPATGCDLFPTFARWAGAEHEPVDGVSLAALLTGETDHLNRAAPLLFHYPHYGQGPAQTPQTAIIDGDWKLLKYWETDTYELYNLANDIGEKNNLAKTQPEKLAAMSAVMDARLKATNAQLPEPNPNHDPDAEPQDRKRSSRKRA